MILLMGFWQRSNDLLRDLKSITKPPRNVEWAVLLLYASYTLGFATWLFTLHWENVYAILVFAAIIVTICFLIHLLYLGKNWVRWSLCVMTLMGF